MRNGHCILEFLLCAGIVLPAFAVEPKLVVDRGIPQINLNTAAGDSRSNIRWSWYDHGFIGDDFQIGQPGEQWVIDGIRTWTVPGTRTVDPEHLGDLYQDVRLYFGNSEIGLTPIATAQLTAGSDETGDARVRVAEVTGSGTLPYEESGRTLRMWQVDFQNLGVTVDGGGRYRFGVWGMGRPIPGKDGKSYAWFNHASNAPLSIVTQDSADGVMFLFDAAGRFEGKFQGEGAGWDKASDINVQVFAHRLK